MSHKYLMTWHRGLDRTLENHILSLMTSLHFGDQWGVRDHRLAHVHWNRFLHKKIGSTYHMKP